MSSIGYFITYIAALFAIIVLFLMPKVNARFALPKVITVGLSALLLCDIVFSLIHQSVWAWLVILLVGAVPFAYVGLVTLLSSRVSSQQQGEMMGVVGSIFAFTWGVGPLLGGFLLGAGFSALYVLVGILFFVAVLLFQKSGAGK